MGEEDSALSSVDIIYEKKFNINYNFLIYIFQ